ncbi:hypothetical protein TRSC58_04337 [Trypanosoma rangeli SC58]|uniref:Uncharacterized protein n=1 Tax=Trypanosoma rangeli SC58 TaxID=429131 RepID=A0A061IXU8_TRYRA|nr:hypothetical protein TRSC58_04337 [Trypanosoma rangeli SC58]
MRRPDADANAQLVKFTDFEDADVCSVFLAAAERAVDVDLHDVRPVSERRIFLSLLTMLSYSGVLYTSDLMAHLMEMVKYSTHGAARDSDAQRVLRYAIRGSSAAQDEVYRSLWHKVETVADSRVVGRYIGAREPWSPTRVCFDERGIFRSYPPLVQAAAKKSSTGDANTTSGTTVGEGEEQRHERQRMSRELAAHKGGTEDEMVEGVRGAVVAETADGAGSKEAALQAASHGEQRTVEALNLRWSDMRRLLERTGALTSPPTERHPQQEKMEVFTGIAVYLRTLATGRRYGGVKEEAEATGSTTPAESREQALFATGYGPGVWVRIFELVQEVRHDMERFITDNAAHHVEPEFECWEALLVTLRCILDFCVLLTQEQGKEKRAAVGELFERAMKLRNELVEESRTRFGGRMRILWLQEA